LVRLTFALAVPEVPDAFFGPRSLTLFPICAGSVRWLNGVIYPLPHNPTDRKLFCYILKDITQSKELEQRLRDNERKLRYAANVRFLFFDDGLTVQRLRALIT
jgi:hypothetical protein